MKATAVIVGASVAGVCFVAGLCVLAEAFNKLERTDVSRKALAALSWRDRISEILRAFGWFAMLLAGAGAAAMALVDDLGRVYIDAGYMLSVIGSACLVARARLQEPIPGCARPDAFDRTVRISPETLAQIRSALPASAVLPDPHRDRIQQVLNYMEQRR